MTLTSSNTKYDSDSGSESEEEYEVFSKLSHFNLIILVQDLMVQCQDKAKHMKILKKQYEQVTIELKTCQNRNEILEKNHIAQVQKVDDKYPDEH